MATCDAVENSVDMPSSLAFRPVLLTNLDLVILHFPDDGIHRAQTALQAQNLELYPKP